MLDIPKMNYDYDQPAQARPQDRPLAVKLPDTDDIKALCQAATPAAIRRLVEIAMDEGSSPGIAVAAIKEILDRGHGKAAQEIKGDYQFQLVVHTGVNSGPLELPVLEGKALPLGQSQD